MSDNVKKASGADFGAETPVYKITENEEDNNAFLKTAADILKNGGLVAFPTETVYGLGASAYFKGAAQKVYAAKGRPSDNPLIVHICDPLDAGEFAYLNDTYLKLAKRFMPGPLTVILKKKSVIDDSVTGGLDTVAVRCPSNVTARRLISLAGVPVAAPSANSSGSPSPTNAGHVFADLNGKIDMIIDGGECDVGLESTVVSLDGDVCTILRPGAVTKEMLLEVCSAVDVAGAVTNPSLAGDKPASPGMKYKHYSPAAEVILVDADDELFAEYVNSDADSKCGVLSSDVWKSSFNCAVLSVGKTGSADEYNHSLYSMLRYADELELNRVYVKKPPETGEYLALYNRLIRAAGGKVIKP